MEFKICNPNENQYGNSKENIFLGFDADGKYLGSSYVYPAINYYQTYETPYIIFLDVNIVNDLEPLLGTELKQSLFDKALLRAKELRKERPDLKARIYSGFEYNEDKLELYIKNGFEEDYSIVMEAELPEGFKYTLPQGVEVIDLKLDTDNELAEYKKMYDEIFVTPLDAELLSEQGKQRHFKNLSFMINGKLQGGCTIFEKDGLGYMETLFVTPDAMGKGISKIIVSYIFDYFLSNGIKRSSLEVWQLNKRAVELYKSFGYVEVKKNIMFPGITV